MSKSTVIMVVLLNGQDNSTPSSTNTGISEQLKARISILRPFTNGAVGQVLTPEVVMADIPPDGIKPDGYVDDVLGRKRSRERRVLQTTFPLYDLDPEVLAKPEPEPVPDSEEWGCISEE